MTLNVPGLWAFRADPAHAGFFYDGPLVPTPEGWFGADRFVQWRNIHGFMRGALYETDLARWGVADRWEIAEDLPATSPGESPRWRGDCESLSMRAKVELEAAGWPKSCMGIWARPRQLGWMPGNRNPFLEAHAVLGVDITVGAGRDAYVNQAALDILSRTPVRRADLWGRGWVRVA